MNNSLLLVECVTDSTFKTNTMRIQVKDFMSTSVQTAVLKNTVEEIRSLMNREGIHAIPIVRYDKQLPKVDVIIQGIVTVSDLSQEIDDKKSAEQIMTAKVHVIHKDSSARAAAQMMLKHKVHHLVVMDEGKIIGMVSSLDFAKLVAEHTLE